MFWYATASLTPAVLIALACLWGGIWPLLALLSITLHVTFMDRLGRMVALSESDGRSLTFALALAHFVLLPLGVWAIGTAGHLDGWDRALIFAALGLFLGQVSNSNAHELIHARHRLPCRLGAAIYISLLHGHHVSAHLRVHHPAAATPDDPNSAPRGIGFWRFLLHASIGEFRAGWQADNAQRARAQCKPSALSHPYVAYIGGGIVALVLAYLIGDLWTLLAYLGLTAYAQMQLLLSDYVQHYGLRRRQRADGRYEPIGPQHSWNAPKWYSSAMMLNAPRHSDHHLRPARAFPALEVTQDMPKLPYSLPVMATIALIPPLWRRVMDRRVQRWEQA
ncbi:alkane 1-monooxygenase [Sulfitobacter delicatus]|uniref:Alkane 1-monooxygenase n=1 Tax=Sulfitobacter delicatus TaxID=218672 RepID=A0A1G7LDX2_9RHOB|nr:alkane 1-monooxygenase [Sulfitobacter delicatus]SDF47159.1 alkane 1-monooxygenase [Sulfitobacter delicatus]